MICRLLLQVSVLATVAASTPLKVGNVMPAMSGQTVSGKLIDLPAANTGAVRLVVFSFSRAAGADSQLWSQHMAKDAASSALFIGYRVIILESVPRLFRGMAVSGIKGGIPPGLWDTTILMYKDEELWKQYLAVSTEKEAYVILLGGNNRVCWLSAGPYTEAAYAELKKELLRCAATK